MYAVRLGVFSLLVSHCCNPTTYLYTLLIERRLEGLLCTHRKSTKTIA